MFKKLLTILAIFSISVTSFAATDLNILKNQNRKGIIQLRNTPKSERRAFLNNSFEKMNNQINEAYENEKMTMEQYQNISKSVELSRSTLDKLNDDEILTFYIMHAQKIETAKIIWPHWNDIIGGIIMLPFIIAFGWIWLILPSV